MTDVGDKLALTINLQRSIGDNGGVTFVTTVPQDADAKELNSLVDKLHAAGRRLAVHAALEVNHNELEQAMLTKRMHEAQADSIEKKLLGGSKMTVDKDSLQKSREQLALIPVHIEKIDNKIKALEEELHCIS